MRRTGDVALRVLLLLAVWVVLGWLVGLAAGGTPDATIASAVTTTAAWFAIAGLVALRDGRSDMAAPYPLWALVGLLTALCCVTWQWAAAAISEGLGDVALLGDDLVILSPGLMVGVWTCAGLGLALGRHDAAITRRSARAEPGTTVKVATAPVRGEAPTLARAAQRPLTLSATRAIHEVDPPLRSS